MIVRESSEPSIALQVTISRPSAPPQEHQRFQDFLHRDLDGEGPDEPSSAPRCLRASMRSSMDTRVGADIFHVTWARRSPTEFHRFISPEFCACAKDIYHYQY